MANKGADIAVECWLFELWPCRTPKKDLPCLSLVILSVFYMNSRMKYSLGLTQVGGDPFQ